MEILHFAAPFLFGLVAIEWILSIYQEKEHYKSKDAISSISLVLGSLILGGVSRTILFSSFYWLYEFRFFTMPNTWATWIIAFILVDFGGYWMHRTMHNVRFLWATHVVHHSSQQFNLSAAFRQPFTESLFEGAFFLFIPLLGFSPEMTIAVFSVNLIYQFLTHTQFINKLPHWFEYIFNTPSHHRIHHSSEVEHLDKNFAGTFIIWDRIFGTFYEEKAHPVKYGLTKDIETYNPIKVAFHEWWAMGKDLLFKARNARDAWKYVVAPPGWSHDGSSKTAKELLAEKNQNL
jgi:sterol desaturase/sphingolipid hydroxylase (fatty acid hydroxylase superfamily)